MGYLIVIERKTNKKTCGSFIKCSRICFDPLIILQIIIFWLQECVREKSLYWCGSGPKRVFSPRHSLKSAVFGEPGQNKISESWHGSKTLKYKLFMADQYVVFGCRIKQEKVGLWNGASLERERRMWERSILEMSGRRRGALLATILLACVSKKSTSP